MMKSYFLGETVLRVGRADQSRSCHSSSYDVADRVDEAGLSGADGPVQKDSEMTDVGSFWLIVLYVPKISFFGSDEKDLIWL